MFAEILAGFVAAIRLKFISFIIFRRLSFSVSDIVVKIYQRCGKMDDKVAYLL